MVGIVAVMMGGGSGSGSGSTVSMSMTKVLVLVLKSEEVVVIEVVKVMIVVVAGWDDGGGGGKRVPSDRGKKQRGGGGIRGGMGMIGSSPPIYVQSMSIHIAKATLERDNVTCIQLLLLHKTAPPFCHHIALAAVPIRISEPPHLPIPVLEIQEQTLLVRRRIKGEVLLRVLLRYHQPVQLPHIARCHHFVKHVFFLHYFLRV